MYCTVLARNPDICQILDLGFRPIQVTLGHRNATTTKTPAPNKWRKILEMIEMRRLAFVWWSCEKLKLRLAYYQILSWMGWFTGNVPASSSEMSHFFPAASFLQRPDPRLKPCVRPAYLQLWDPSHVADPTWVASFFIFELWACALQMQGPNIQMHPQNWPMIWKWTWHTVGESNITMINPSYPIHLYQSSSMFD